ncbi:hypothetical protein GSH19_05245 [Lactobacillus sp. S2-2]|uniref:phage tail terminator family protein n=1 Tax=Lactobacillus sp. S2-2 TaxID=2692917 RepID=UPI001F32DCFF|nr:hypothetical protein [Lactobacillus sp. S2-2]MCF6515558.1 hypothetical protein [Lactobacillus sp. S2-2]
MIDVKRNIGLKLRKLYPNIKIYTKKQESGFVEPAFFVAKISTRTNPLLFDNENRSYSYQLVYFPKSDKVNAELDETEDYLLNNFKVLDNFAHIRNREFIQQDNCLICNFDVNIFAKAINDQEKMKNIQSNERVD